MKDISNRGKTSFIPDCHPCWLVIEETSTSSSPFKTIKATEEGDTAIGGILDMPSNGTTGGAGKVLLLPLFLPFLPLSLPSSLPPNLFI